MPSMTHPTEDQDRLTRLELRIAQLEVYSAEAFWTALDRRTKRFCRAANWSASFAPGQAYAPILSC